MFKKRNNANKKIDLQEEAERIEANNQQQETVREQSSRAEAPGSLGGFGGRMMNGRNKIKGQSVTLENMEIDELAQERHPGQEPEHIVKEEISDYLNQIRKMRPQESLQDLNEETGPKMNHSILVQDHHNEQGDQLEDHYMLEVEQDLEGGLSPERDDNPFHEDYEDELIRRTLTRHNYEKVRMRGGGNLADLKAIESQDKILQKLQKVTAKRIENTIKRDLESKMKKWEILREDMRTKEGIALRQRQEIEKKERRLNQMQAELSKLNQVIEYLYFYGDKVNTFEVGAILRQLKDEEKIKNQYNFEDVS